MGALYFRTQAAAERDVAGLNAGDTAWVLTAAALVMLMTPAVGLFYGGMVGRKSVVATIKQTIAILALVSIQWVILGYSLSFGRDYSGIIGGLNFLGLSGVGAAPNADYAATIPHSVFMLFQLMFAAITPALIIGAVASRIRFRTLLVFTALWATIVYDPIAHWVWGAGGWLHSMGALDFAGGTVVHVSAGFSALAAAIVVGKRHDYKRGATGGAHNVPMTLLGAALLWFGWFGFNAGSALAANGLAASAFTATNLAAAAAALVWMILSWADFGKPSALAAATGAVAGLVAITPASGFVGPMSAIAIGVLGGIATYVALVIRSRHTSIDDSLDVFACHGVGGMVGALLTGVFAEKAINAAGANGLLFGNPSQMFPQIVAVAASAIYAFAATFVILKVLDALMGLRIPAEEEKAGIDVSVHGEEGYNY
ncbi:ammonium transporter [Candidatus Micrarchaeota archaeon]|nr:ammonium transporter [Candidatus Micrarchaeota archaeon]MBI5177050.1 ammonium transporter [Candidatus Micrarchaeota archaeon]